MSFLVYDLIFFAVFTLGVILFLYKRKKNIRREGIVYLYRTKLGIELIDYIGGKNKKIINFLQYISVFVGYVLMIGVMYMLIRVVYIYLFFPQITQLVKAPPLVPLIPYFPAIFGVQSFFPPFYFTYFILAIAVVAVVHEFSHGIVAKANGLKIKSTGFAFIGPIIGAFVEPDEKAMKRKSKFTQMSILSAGVFANLIVAAIFFALIFIFMSVAFTQSGAIFSTYAMDAVNVSAISSIQGYALQNPSTENIINLIDSRKIENNFSINLDSKPINLTEIEAGNRIYFIDVNLLKEEVNSTDIIVAYGDYPAIRAGLKGAIIEFNGNKISNQKELSAEIENTTPGQNIMLKTNFNGNILTYNLILTSSPDNESLAFLGVASFNMEQAGFIKGTLYRFLNSFKDPATLYAPKSSPELTIFIRDLLWWIIIINFFVAFFNMIPAGIFDGGRFFYLIILSITKSEKNTKKVYKIMMYLILLILAATMVSWLLAII